MLGMNFTRGLDEVWPDEVTHVRLWDQQVHWGAIHKRPGHFDWDRLDAFVDKANGRHVLYVLGGVPQWAAKYPLQPHFAPWLGPGSNSVPADVGHHVEFVRALVERYRGRIHAYELWNEPQLAEFWYPYTDKTVDLMVDMNVRASRVIRSVDPNARVLSGSVLPRPSSGGMKRALRYLATLRKAAWPVDGFTTHIYPEVGFGVQRWQSLLSEVKATLRDLGAPVKRLWVTETLIGLKGPFLSESMSRSVVQRLYSAAKGTPVWWYAPNRLDLGGLQIVTRPGEESLAWLQMKESHAA